jgi:hypothetical protein
MSQRPLLIRRIIETKHTGGRTISMNEAIMSATIEQRNPPQNITSYRETEWIMARKELLAKEKVHPTILVSTAVESSYATDEGEYPARWSCGTRIFTTAST